MVSGKTRSRAYYDHHEDEDENSCNFQKLDHQADQPAFREGCAQVDYKSQFAQFEQANVNSR